MADATTPGELAGGSPAGRPYVVAALAASADGRTALAGRARDLIPPAHRDLVRALRARVDAVLVGTRTVARDGDALDLDDRLTVVMTRTLALRLDVPLFRDPGSRVLVLSAAPVVMPAVAAAVTVQRLALDELEPAAALRRLRDEHGIRALLCAGGPTMVGALVAAGALDELHLTIVPRLAGAGEPPILAERLAAPRALALQAVSEAQGSVRLTYRLDDGSGTTKRKT